MVATIPDIIRAALRRRGVELRSGDKGLDDFGISEWPSLKQDQFYQAMQRYSFRMVLREVLRLGQHNTFSAEDLTRYTSLNAVKSYLQQLLDFSIIRRNDNDFELLTNAASIGPTLEWFIAEVLRRELNFCVGRSIPLRGGLTGGDLDVVALGDGQLILVEVKSGPPKHLSEAHVTAFLDRIRAVAPNGAIFFNDTQLRMADKIVVLFEKVLTEQHIARQPKRLRREIFEVGPGIFIANAKPDIIGNITFCISHFLRSQGLQLVMDLGSESR